MAADPKSVDGRRETARFARWTFESYRDAATDPNLSANERIGMPDAFREGFGAQIWADIRTKLPALDREGARVFDIGPGCAEPPRLLIQNAERLGQTVLMVDHEEMLAQLPDSPAVTKLAGRFPETPDPHSDLMRDGFDAILVYSVIQTIINEANPFAFVDAAMALLRPGGQLLVGDVPNVSKQRRFLASEAGVEHHKAYMRTDEPPEVPPFAMALDRIDDGLLLGLMVRARNAGFDAYLMPQASELPLANRREDLLIVRP